MHTRTRMHVHTHMQDIHILCAGCLYVLAYSYYYSGHTILLHIPLLVKWMVNVWMDQILEVMMAQMLRWVIGWSTSIIIVACVIQQWDCSAGAQNQQVCSTG